MKSGQAITIYLFPVPRARVVHCSITSWAMSRNASSTLPNVPCSLLALNRLGRPKVYGSRWPGCFAKEYGLRCSCGHGALSHVDDYCAPTERRGYNVLRKRDPTSPPVRGRRALALPPLVPRRLDKPPFASNPPSFGCRF